MTSNEVEKVQNWVKGIINDPLARTLLENSRLTQTQLETLLIDILADQLIDKKISYMEKSTMRLTDRKISRGAFSRTLQQARQNMTRSVLTVLLLGYVGVLETPSLSPFLEASNKLENYMREFVMIKKEEKNDFKDKRTLNSIVFLKENLKNIIYDLMMPKKGLTVM